MFTHIVYLDVLPHTAILGFLKKVFKNIANVL